MFGVFGGLSAHGCFSPVIELGSCSVECASDAECPPGFDCADGYCKRRGDAVVCAAVADEPPATFVVPSENPPAMLPCAESNLEPCPLLAPCQGVPYSTTLSATDASDERWQPLEVPPGLSFDPIRRTLSGTPTGPGTLRLRATDTAGVALRDILFEVTPRQSCWFAHVTEASTPASLELYDRVLDTTLSLPVSEAAGEAVSDFAFSPDGRFLAIRTTNGAGVRHLHVYAAPLWQDLSLELDGSVSRYAWSPDSAVLALGLDTEQGTFLGGLRVPDQALPLVAAPERVDSELLWFADHRLVYAATARGFSSEDGIWSLHHSVLEAGGLGAVVVDETSLYGPGLRIVPTREGFFVLSPQQLAVEFYAPREPGLARTKVPTSLVSPDGLFTARQRAAELGVFRVTEARLDEQGFALPLATHDGCDALLAWSPAATRLACLAAAGEQAEIRLFDLEANASRLAVASLTGQYSSQYVPARALEHRRAFSPRGRFLAFTTDDQLYVADLDSPPYVQLHGSPLERELGSIELAFSPDERLLIVHQGRSLLRVGLDPFQSAIRLGDGLATSKACSDAEAVAATPESWCGASADRTDDIVWAPDSNAIAFQDAAHRIRLQYWLDPTHAIEDKLVCSSGCAARAFAFQPAPASH